MQRVLIVGPCGAGKSTLAFELAARTGLPLFHMDKLAWEPGWVDRSNEELRAVLAQVLAGERWIIEGNYGSTLAQRLQHADAVIYLDFPVRLCLWRLLRRFVRYRGQTRPDMTEGCNERLDPGFLWYVTRWNAGPRKRLEVTLSRYQGAIVRFATPKELKNWLAAPALTFAT